MKKIRAYQAEDGTVFLSEQEARDHDKKCRITKSIKSLCEEHCAPYENRPEDLADAILEHKDDFMNALKGWFIPPGETCNLCGGGYGTGHQRLCEVFKSELEDEN